MPADYEKIREENIARYGWDTAVLDLLGQLYSERTHFIFELIQNAEDAGATELAFELFEDRLELRHDGRPFTEADVRGVCGVGKSGKSGDLTAIGKFGIGFKSVYAYTQTPRIYSGTSISGSRTTSGRLRRPLAQAPDGTLFVFPSTMTPCPPRSPSREIAAALNAIQPRILLFLRNIERLRTGRPGAESSAGQPLGHRALGRGAAGGRLGASRCPGTGRREEWLVWHRQVEGHPGQRVEIAFRLEDAPDRRRWPNRR